MHCTHTYQGGASKFLAYFQQVMEDYDFASGTVKMYSKKQMLILKRQKGIENFAHATTRFTPDDSALDIWLALVSVPFCGPYAETPQIGLSGGFCCDKERKEDFLQSVPSGGLTLLCCKDINTRSPSAPYLFRRSWLWPPISGGAR